ncbi:MAG: hypothetical protein LWX02_01345 [Deltaproteobacteria bacterium]|nr:hypothetical protein [Deltaproteobacteria bacterium]MDL1986865.1 hypothetical protein [Deltaproteobacteria bacterium]MDL2122877.1 hypothetical protein [Deltaproteobacteria bacterium]
MRKTDQEKGGSGYEEIKIAGFFVRDFGFILLCVSLADEEKKEDVDKSVKLERIVVTSPRTDEEQQFSL